MTEIEFLQDFGRQLTQLLKENRMSQSELARRLNMDHTMISRYCRGLAMPSLKTVSNIAYALDCDITDLIYIDEPIE